MERTTPHLTRLDQLQELALCFLELLRAYVGVVTHFRWGVVWDDLPGFLALWAGDRDALLAALDRLRDTLLRLDREVRAEAGLDHVAGEEGPGEG